MQGTPRTDPSLEGVELRVPKLAWLIGALLLVALVVLVVTHLGEAERFARLLERAEPGWLLVALALQIGTYAFAGGIWHLVVASAGRRLHLSTLARLSVEKLSVDQIVPAGGMAGNVVVTRALQRLGLPGSLAVEALLVDVLTYYAAFALVAGASLLVLWLHHGATAAVLVSLAVFTVIAAGVPLGISLLLRRRRWTPPAWMARLPPVRSMLEAVRQVSPEHVRRPALLARASMLQVGIFLLDSVTLWVMMHAVGTPVHVLTAFAALVMASIAATVSFIPGGIGSFEAGCTATLTLLGTPVEAALTGTLLLRGLTLWLPLGPGLLLARRELPRARRGTTSP